LLPYFPQPAYAESLRSFFGDLSELFVTEGSFHLPAGFNISSRVHCHPHMHPVSEKMENLSTLWDRILFIKALKSSFMFIYLDELTQ
jgi:hypothetical protein